MISQFVYIRLVFIQQIIVIACDSTEPKIGNYSQYIKDYNLCGLSRSTLRDESSDCFEYHKDFSSDLRYGRPPQLGESPWMVSIGNVLSNGSVTKGCGGVLISDKWVLTAAHCLHYDGYRIFIHENVMGGKSIESEVNYKHPNFTSVDRTGYYDIGLIKMKKSFDYDTGRNYKASTICLPSKGSRIKRNRFAMISGWGPNKKDAPWNKGLEIGPIVIFEHKDSAKELTHLFFKSVFGIDKPDVHTCRGDSGSPVWIYHMGRAVLVGINSAGYPPKYFKDRDMKFGRECSHDGTITFVPHFIDWIIEKINMHDETR